jgi:hypothetical protein
MKASDRRIVMVVPLVALAIAFWLLVLSPKRQEAASLKEDVVSLEAEVSQLEQTVAAGEQAREDFSSDYKKVVVLGKAVPEGDDQASLLAQLSEISQEAGVTFRRLELAASVDEEGESATESAPAPEEAPAEASGSDTSSTASPAPATEEAAAVLPIGATVGPAGLAVMPYTLDFEGNFLRVADFIRGLDSTVNTADGQVGVEGRLLTIDGFSLTQDPTVGFPSLAASFAVTTYLTTPGEGVMGGTPEAPVPAATDAPSASPEVASPGEVTPSSEPGAAP